MWRLAFLSIISGCSDGASPAKCGAGMAPASINVTAGSEMFTYDMLESGANNDCPDPMAPSGVVAMTIERPSGMPPLFTFCVPRPDKLAAGPLQLGTDVKFVDLTGSANGCTYVQDGATPATGTVSASGLCKNGLDPAGFALTIQGTLPLKRTCSGTTDSVAATVSGTIAVFPQ